MPNGGSIVATTYLGGEFAVQNYNVMGVAKASLEANVNIFCLSHLLAAATNTFRVYALVLLAKSYA